LEHEFIIGEEKAKISNSFQQSFIRGGGAPLTPKLGVLAGYISGRVLMEIPEFLQAASASARTEP
jgi:hypothetical protein